ncbi:hypothetical protein ACWD4F_21815 [Streptomyces aureus]
MQGDYPLEYQDMHRLFIECIEILADSEKRRAMLHVDPNGRGLGFDDVLNFLYDDSGILRDPIGSVGLTIMPGQLNSVTCLRDSLDVIVDSGEGERCVADSLWVEVERAAREVLLNEGEQRE